MATKSYTAIVEKEGSGYVALCPELDVASQGDTVESATANLKEAVELFLECADPAEDERRLHIQVFCHPLRSGSWVSFAPLWTRCLPHPRTARFSGSPSTRKHVVMQRRSDLGTVTIPVPDHTEIRIGTLQAIIRQSAVARTAFET
jgi:predicted RNase H-like HicB family nuclease/predicted RNA binding protein YcfA (HicA-like mRNA interferase family)